MIFQTLKDHFYFLIFNPFLWLALVMLKRLDDVSNTVRIGALNTIAAVFTNLPIDYDITHYQPYVEHAYTTLILHLDDSDQEIQDKVQSKFRQIGSSIP